VGSTTNPPKLVELGNFWTAAGGRNLGIKGDASHAAKGVSYHLGKDELRADAGSRKLQRDKDGLTNSASAIDLGKLDGSLQSLRVFSKSLVARCIADAAVRRDIREIIYTADGTTVQRYDSTDNKIHKGPNQGDLSHLGHTHISYFRDSEFRDKVAVFRPFFEPAWGTDVSAEIQALDPKATKVASAIRKTGHDFGNVINVGDLAVAIKKIGHPFGAVVDPGDVQALLKA